MSKSGSNPRKQELNLSDLSREELEETVRRLRKEKKAGQQKREQSGSPDDPTSTFEEVFNSFPQALFLLNVEHTENPPNFTFRKLNDTHERLTGLTTEQVAGRTPGDLFDSNIADHLVSKYRECVEQKDTIMYQETLKFPARSGIWETDLTPIIENGHVKSILGQSRPLSTTDLMERETGQFRHILEASGHAVMVTDPDGTITFVNDAFENMSGYDRKEAIGNTPELLHSGEHDDAFFRDLWETISSGDVWHGQILNEAKNGNLYWTRQTIAPVRTTQGDVWAYVSLQEDITDQKEIQQNHRLKSQAMDSAPLGILMTDQSRDDNPIFYANKGFEQLTGYEQEEIIGRNCRFLQGPETREEPVEELRKAVREERELTVELRNYRKDGTMFWNRLLIAPLRDEDGEVTHFIGFQHDITEEKRAKQQLQVFRETIDESPDELYILNPDDGRILDANRTAETTLGYERDELLSLRVKDISQHVEDNVSWEELRERLEAQGPLTIETEHVRKDGTTLPVEVHADYVEFEDRTRIVSAARDVTKLKKARREAQEWADFLESVNDQMPGVTYQFKVDPDGTYSFPYISEGYHELAGVTADEATADFENALRNIHPDDQEHLLNSIEEAQDPPSDWSQEYRFQLPDGRTKWVLGSSTPETQEDGAVVWSGILIDITDRKRMEKSLAEKERRFRTIYEEADEPMVITSLDDDILDLNPAAANHLGYDPDDLIGKSVERILPPERRENPSASIIRQRLEKHGTRLFKTEHMRSDGTRVPVEISQTRIDYQGHDAVLSFTRDLSRLEWSRRRMRAIFNSTQSFIALLDPRGRMLDQNKSILNALGVPEEELVGQPLTDLDWWASPEDREDAEKALSSAQEGILTRFRASICPSDGGERIIDLGLSPITDEQDDLIYLVLEGRDVTAREEQKKALEVQEKRFRTIFENAPIGLWEEDWSGARTYLEKLKRAEDVDDLEAYLDAHPEELKKALDRIEILLPNETLLDITGAESKQQLFEKFNHLATDDLLEVVKNEFITLLSGQTSYSSKTAIRRFDGERRHILRDTQIVPGHETDWSRIFVSYRDISDEEKQRQELQETRRREERFRQLAETVGVIFWLYDPEQDRYVYLSEDCNQVYGLSCDVLAEGYQKLLNRIHPEDRDRVRQLFQNQLSEGFEVKYRMNVEDEWVWVQDRAYPVQEDGQVTLVAGIAEDITEQVEQEQNLQKQIAETERINKLKSDFVARTTHDLRTPLTAILGHTDLLQETDLSPEQRRELERIAAAGRSMLHLTNDILDLDQIEHGKLKLHEKPTPIRSLFEDVISLFRPISRNTNVTLSLELDDRVPEFLLVDPDRLKQILINLVGNALKFTEEGRVDVLVDYHETEDREGNLQVRVSDTGPGISPEQQEAIFQEREKDRDAGLVSKSGAGLGLSITQELVYLMEGDISVDSEPGEGSTFTFHITTDAAEPPEDEPEAVPEPFSLEGIHVLVVDDSRPIRSLLTRLLEEESAITSTAKSCSEALDLLTGSEPAEPFDVVFLDVQMPDGSGFDVLKQTDAPSSNVDPERIYLLSGKSADQIRDDLPDINIAGVLEKPIEKSVLKDSIRSIVQSSASPETNQSHPSREHLECTVKNILVAEDEPSSREILQRYLDPIAECVTIVPNGRKAVQHRFQNCPDVLLMDQDMPELNGLEALQIIRKREKEEDLESVPIIMQTAQAMKKTESDSFKAGADAFIKKPFDKKTLYETISSVLT